MTRSERIAVAATLAMTLPAFLVFPALGIEHVIRMWPRLSTLNHAVFCLSVASFFAAFSYSLPRRLDLIFYGRTTEFGLFEQVSLLIPIGTGMWALTGHWAVLGAIIVLRGTFFIFKLEEELTSSGRKSTPTYTTEPMEVEQSIFARLRLVMRRKRQTVRTPILEVGRRRKAKTKHG